MNRLESFSFFLSDESYIENEDLGQLANIFTNLKKNTLPLAALGIPEKVVNSNIKWRSPSSDFCEKIAEFSKKFSKKILSEKVCHKPDSLRNIQQYIAIYIPLPSFMLSLFYRIYFRTTESGCQSTHLDQHPLSMWYYYHSFFTSLFYLLFDRSTYVPGGPYLLFLDFHRTSVSDGFFKYRFYFSHNFLVIMIFLCIFPSDPWSRYPMGE